MKIQSLLIGMVWLGAMLWLHTIHRSDFYSLWSVYSIAFASYAWLVFGSRSISLTAGLLLAVAARIISFIFEPLLSDDYYRFIWDGALFHEGIHPLAYTPAYLMQHPDIVQMNGEVFALLNSQHYYSVYPPASQWFFALSFRIHQWDIPGHILFFKMLLLAADALIVFLLYKLMQLKNLPVRRVCIYALNPLVLIEFCGNLHMDGLMIAGFLGALVWMEKRHVLWSSIFMSFSILSKWLTLLLIPFIPEKTNWKKFYLFSFLTLLWTVSLFWFSFGSYTGWLDSVLLWFRSFEFNAGLYYIFRWIGFQFTGYNPIGLLGPALGICSFFGIIFIWWKYIRHPISDGPRFMLYALSFFFILSTTIHPWYLVILLALSIPGHHLYPVIWTYLVFLSYSHYHGGQFEEQYVLLAVEYILLAAWITWEWRAGKFFKKNYDLK